MTASKDYKLGYAIGVVKCVLAWDIPKELRVKLEEVMRVLEDE